tara:strand:- start:539 stop:1651 length:1113 start_codon:yes stop_codon:yes gene_type:complete
MTKIIIVGPASPLRGGISDFNEALAKSLVEKGFLVEIISFSLQYPKFLFPGKSQNRVEQSVDFKFKITPLINSINPISWWKTAKYIKSKKPSKVFIRFWMPFFAPCLGVIGGYLKRNNFSVFGIVDNAIAHEKRFGDTRLVNFFLNKCNSHFTLSEKVKNDIKTINNTVSVESLFHPIYNTYSKITNKDSALKKLNLNEGKYILFFGLIRKYKGLDLAIKAMSNKLIIQKNIKLIIAGEFYDSEDKYQKLVKDLNLKNIIIFNHFIEKKHVPDFFSVSNLVILPYTSATQSGVTQLAMYYKKPMLVTNVGGLPEIIDHNKDGYISSTNPEEMSKYILDYFSKDTNEIEMSSAVSEKQSSYSWDNFVDKII